MIQAFLDSDTLSGFSDAHVSWAHDYAIIRLYREFEKMILNCLVAAINNDTAQLSQTTGISFPKHLTDAVCEYIIVGDGYFDFRGRDGLIKTLKTYLPENHYLVMIVKEGAYRTALEQLSTLRNFAAHDSKPSKERALRAINGQRMASAGAWLKTQNRFGDMSTSLIHLARKIYRTAPY